MKTTKTNNILTLAIKTKGIGFINITDILNEKLNSIADSSNGILHLFVMHTSCALAISEAFDPSARLDLEKFMDHLAPTNLSFIKHTSEGRDDSPSHMKSLLLHQSLATIVSEGEILLGRWQGIFLCEFREDGANREIILKFCAD
ncbi:MAG: YjbQ family protein [Oligoflexia bacterium]|nr:YjbQ family protein [Oligoflexia bacterium]